MSRREKKEDSSEEPGLGSLFKVGAAVVGAAAVAYGAWKLLDFLGATESEGATGGCEESETCKKKKAFDSDSEDDASDTHPINRMQSSKTEFRPENVKSNESAAVLAKGETCLYDRLMGYYSNYVEICPTDLKEAQRVMKEVKVLVASQLKSMPKLTAVETCDLLEFGNAADSLNVIVPEEFEILIPIKLEIKDWHIEDGDDRHGCISVVLSNKTLMVEVCDGDGKVTPYSLRGLFRGAVERAVRSCRGYDIDSFVQGSSIRVAVKYGQKKLVVIFKPAIIIGDDLLTPIFLHSNSENCQVPDEEGCFWKRSHTKEEHESIERFSPAIASHRIVLKIFYAISLNWPSLFGILGSYHYKTILLRLLDEQPDELDWDNSTLPEHFIDFLIELGSCLKDNNMPHQFNSCINLFEGINPESLRKLADFVNKLVGQQDFADLLKSDYHGARAHSDFTSN